MNNEDFKEYIKVLIEANTGKIKEHINNVNDKAREDFNNKFNSQEKKINSLSDRTTENSNEIKFAKRIGMGLAGLVTLLGFDKFIIAIKSIFG